MNFSPVCAKRSAPRFLAQAQLVMDYKVYVLRSLKSGKRYVGMTSQEVHDKLTEYNTGSSRWSRMHRPFELVYQQAFDSKTAALKRERFLKSGDGRRVLDKLVKDQLCFSPVCAKRSAPRFLAQAQQAMGGSWISRFGQAGVFSPVAQLVPACRQAGSDSLMEFYVLYICSL